MHERVVEIKVEAADGLIPQARRFIDSLAGRLLGLTALAVVAVELMIFVPALSNFHDNWLQDRINLAQTAAIALAVAPQDYDITDTLQFELLRNAEVRRIAMKSNGQRELILDDGGVNGQIVIRDWRTATPFDHFLWTFETFFAPPGRALRILDKPRFESGDFIEIIMNEEPLKKAMSNWALGFAVIATLILAAAASLMYAALTFAFVRPIRELTRAIERFRDAPEDASIAFVRSARADEIGRAERAAADMAEQIRGSLRQRERLAALGAAVARIGHDLRNMLSTAQLVTDRLSSSEDPTVRQIAPRLERSIGRAAGLAASTLKFGHADEAAPKLARVDLNEAIAAAVEDALASFDDVACAVEGAEGAYCTADPDQLHRILVNLLRNGARVMAGQNRKQGLVVRALSSGKLVAIMIEDHGPGVPDKVRARLFEPFVTGERNNAGTGLGLTIARELARAMGGDVALLRSDKTGAVFQITLPAGQ